MSWLAAPTAQATVILELDLPHLVGRSDAIFVGKVLRAQSRWTADGKRIVTDYTLRVTKPILGTKQDQQVMVRRPGGTVGEIGMRVSGAVQLAAGQRVLLFTQRRPTGQRYVVGMKQGAFRLQRDSAGRDQVQGNLAGLSLARRGADGRMRLSHGGSTQPRPLTQFVDQIHRTVALCAKEKSRCRRQRR